MDELRDYVEWHKAYDDPESALSWRLSMVERYLTDALDRHEGSVQVLSLCSGDGRDLLDVLSKRPDAGRVNATLIEIHPGIAARAYERALAAGLEALDIRVTDAGDSSSYEGAVPADIVLMVGIFGNVSHVDIERTVRATPELCKQGATLIWSRGRDKDDLNDAIRGWFGDVGFDELEYAARERGGRAALGAVIYRGDPRPLVTGQRLFTFLR